MTNEEAKLELQARAYRKAHGLSLPGDDAPLEAPAPPAAPPAPAPIRLDMGDRMLIAHAERIRQGSQQAGVVFGRHALSPAMNAILDVLTSATAAPAATPQPRADAAATPAPALDRQFQVLAAMREQRQEQAARPVSQPLAQGFLRTPTLFELAGGK